jgi:hypothetical protein
MEKKMAEKKNKKKQNKRKRKRNEKRGFFLSLKEGWASEKKNKIIHLNVWFGLG